jgi:hypothetical protein
MIREFHITSTTGLSLLSLHLSILSRRSQDMLMLGSNNQEGSGKKLEEKNYFNSKSVCMGNKAIQNKTHKKQHSMYSSPINILFAPHTSLSLLSNMLFFGASAVVLLSFYQFYIRLLENREKRLINNSN